MKIIYIKLDEKSSLFKSLKERNLLDYQSYLSIRVLEVPRIGELFSIPYSSMTDPKKNDVLNKYLSNRKNNKPKMRVEDLFIDQVSNDFSLFYLKCSYVIDTQNWC